MATQKSRTPQARAKSAAPPQSQYIADVAYREMTRLWQAKEIVQLAAHASDTIALHEDKPPMMQALECVAEMLQTSIEALCSLEEKVKSDAAEVAHV